MLNEIVELSKTEAIGNNRFKYVFSLVNSPFMLKFKHGCEVWDKLIKKHRQIINNLIPQTIKRILELPKSTPSMAIKHDFGILDLSNEIELEKILLTQKVLEMDGERIAKRLLDAMIDKEVPGYCSHVLGILKKYNIDLHELRTIADPRAVVRKIIVDFEKSELLKKMMMSTKTDAMAVNYAFDGKMKSYLRDLPFPEGRMVFVFRSRMFPTRVNFPQRWSKDRKCIFCRKLDTDEHLFLCWGYRDFVEGESVRYEMFYKLDADADELGRGARVLQKIYDRLIMVQEDKDMVMRDDGS